LRKILISTSFLIVASLAASGHASKRPDSDPSSNRPIEKEKEVLRLLGGGGDEYLSAHCPDLLIPTQSRSTIRELIRKKDWADQFHETAKKISNQAKKCRKLSIAFQVEGHTDIGKIKEILGSEDSTETAGAHLNGEDIELTRFNFQWLSFGVHDGKVKMVYVDFKKRSR